MLAFLRMGPSDQKCDADQLGGGEAMASPRTETEEERGGTHRVVVGLLLHELRRHVQRRALDARQHLRAMAGRRHGVSLCTHSVLLPLEAHTALAAAAAIGTLTARTQGLRH